MEGHALPAEFDVTLEKNIAWRTPVPGLAHSGPAIVGDRIFLTTAVKEGEAPLKVGLYGDIGSVDDDSPHEMRVLCLDRTSGEVLWTRTAWTGVPKIKRHPKGSHAASSPAADAKHVVAFFGSEGLYCYDHEGNLAWSRDFGVLDSGFFRVPDAQWGFASSPVIHGDTVLVQCDVQGDSFIAALSLADGTDVWRTPRDEVPTWSTPTVDVREGRAQVIANGWHHIGGYDLATGAELWSLTGGGDIPVPTPIVHGDLVFITSAHGKMAPIYAIRVDAAGTIDDEESPARVWTHTRRGNYMQTPIVHGDRLYCCSDSGILGCYDTATGAEVYRERLGMGMSGFSASAVAGDGKLYFTSEEGEVYTVTPGDELKVTGISNLDETCMATPAISQGNIFFRTRSHLVAVGEPRKTSDNWPSFRGHRASGIADGHALPTTWDFDAGTNVAWRTPVPGLAHSSPIVWGDRLFVTTAVKAGAADLKVGLYGAGEPVEDEGEHAFRVYGLDKRTGGVLWERTLHEGEPKIKRHPKSTHANSTPATDGRHLVVFFGSEGLYGLDLDGNVNWTKDLGVLNAGAPDLPEYQWGFASSPILHRGRVYVQCDVNGDSFLASFDAGDGRELWRVARDEAATWCTPTVVTHDGGELLVVNGYRHIGGYALEDGREIWKLTGGGDVPVPTPVSAHGLVYLTSAHGRMAPVYAVRADAEGAVSLETAGEADPAMVWGKRRRGNYMQTPLAYRDWLYCCHDTGVLTCYDARSGEELYRERLGGGTTGFSGSGVAGDGKLYFGNEAGDVYVVQAGPEFKVIADNWLGETCLASPAVSEGVMFFRTRGHVVAVADQ